MKEDKKFSYSKILPITTGSIFLIVIIFSFIAIGFPDDFGNSAAVLGTMLGAAGGVFGSSIIWYMKKAQAENVYKLDLAVFKEKSALELEQYEKILQIKDKYHLTDVEFNQLQYETDLDDMTRDSFQRMQNNVTQSIQDANMTQENISMY